MKFVIIGGSGQSTPHLAAVLAGFVDLSKISIVLVGRSKARLAAVRRASRLLASSVDIDISVVSTADPGYKRALLGADVVLVQPRFGGFPGRHFDETFSLSESVCGDQDLGPGALSAGWRTWPSMLAVLEWIWRTTPEALVLMMSSPVGLLVRCGKALFPSMRLFGICELPAVTLTQLAEIKTVSPADIQFCYCGINHFGWFYNLRYDGTNLIEDIDSQKYEKTRLPGLDLAKIYNGIPTKYAHLYLAPDLAAAEQKKATRSRAQVLFALSQRAMKVFAEGSEGEIRAVLAERPAEWYRMAVAPILLGTLGQHIQQPLFFSANNGGYIELCRHDDILEIPYRMDRKRLEPLENSSPPPAEIRSMVLPFIVAERTAAKAIILRDSNALFSAMILHPWIKTTRAAEL